MTENEWCFSGKEVGQSYLFLTGIVSSSRDPLKSGRDSSSKLKKGLEAQASNPYKYVVLLICVTLTTWSQFRNELLKRERLSWVHPL